MSGCCVVNLKKHNLSFEKLNDLANRLVQIALANGVGVRFHGDNFLKLIKSEKMENYFFLSDSFVYSHCEFLEENRTLYKFTGARNFEEYIDFVQDVTRFSNFKEWFFGEFRFLKEMVDCIFQFEVDFIEIFITPIYNGNDYYEPIPTEAGRVLSDLFYSMEDYNFTKIRLEIPTPQSREYGTLEERKRKYYFEYGIEID